MFAPRVQKLDVNIILSYLIFHSKFFAAALEKIAYRLYNATASSIFRLCLANSMALMIMMMKRVMKMMKMVMMMMVMMMKMVMMMMMVMMIVMMMIVMMMMVMKYAILISTFYMTKLSQPHFP